MSGANPGIFDSRGPNVSSERTVELFYGKLLLTETTTCFLSVKAVRRWRGKHCEKRRTDQRKRVLNEDPWNLV